MDALMYSLGLLLFLFIPTKEALHIFQQNHYHLDRYCIWMIDKAEEKKAQCFYYVLLFLPMLLLLVFFSHPNILALEALLLFVYAYIMMKIDDEKVYVKPLSYTHRLIRQMLFQYFLYVVCLIILLQMSNLMILLLTPFFYLVCWGAVIISGWCMRFVEKKIQNHYVQDAKRMLKENPKRITIGITGSYGKTSVKTILYLLLSNRYYTLMTPNSYNNLMGITITIRSQLKGIHEAFLCEMGADHVHEIKRLAQFVNPKIGIVTAIGPQHLQTFHSMENIVYEKMQLIEQLPSDGIAFLNRDNPYIRDYVLQNEVKTVWFSIDQPSDYQARQLLYHAEGMSFAICNKGMTYAFETKLLGEHNVRNITAAVAVAHTLGVPMSALQKTVRELPYVEHRLQPRKTATYTLLDNAYNSNPEGAKESLAVLRQMPGRHVLITPGFIDLGDVKQEAHKEFGKQISRCADEVILIGRQQTRDIYESLLKERYSQERIHIVASTAEALQLAASYAKEGDVVLIENDLPDAFNH